MSAPTITPMPGRVPAVEVHFSSFPAGTAKVTVWRLAGGRRHKVRGAVRVATAGALSRIDYEVPFGVLATYRAECFDAAGEQIGFTDAGDIVIDEPHMWVHNPLDPQGAVRVDFLDRAARSISAQSLGEVHHVQGRRVGVFLGGPQAGITGVDLSIAVDSTGDIDRVMTMLGRGEHDLPPVLCFRLGAGHRVPLPRPFYAVTPDYAVEDLDYVYGGETLHIVGTGSEVEPPAAGIFVPLLTLGDLDRAYATYGDLKAHNLTYGDVNRRYDLAETE